MNNKKVSNIKSAFSTTIFKSKCTKSDDPAGQCKLINAEILMPMWNINN